MHEEWTALCGAVVLIAAGSGCAPGPRCERSWAVQGDQGAFVAAPAGDVNGDGYDDVVVAQKHYGDDEGPCCTGRALLYLGGTCGLSPEPSWAVEGDRERARLGNSVAAAGDVDGDGYADVVVGAASYPPRGRAYLYLGSRHGLSAEPAETLVGEEPYDAFGITVASAGDVDGDGFSDVAVAACRGPDPRGCRSDALVYLGSPDGPHDEPAWIAQEEGTRVPTEDQAWLAPAGDVNGDGFSDLVLVGWGWVGDLYGGRTFLYLGSPDGLSNEPAWSAGEGDAGLGIGSSVAAAGDVNGDGFDDVLVGGATASGYGAFLYRGSSNGLSSEAVLVVEDDERGRINVAAGDVDGDGLGDVIVGTRRFENGQEQEGAVRLYLGSSDGLTQEPVWMIEGDQRFARLGKAVASAGDVDGDGLDDLLVAAIDGGIGGTSTIRLHLASTILR